MEAQDRIIKFRAFIPDLNIMLENISVYDNGHIGICEDDFRKAIKGKAIMTDDAVWSTVGENELGEHIMNLLVGDDWIWLEKGQFRLMQFTGLTDKNGKEIYEGDILSCDVMRIEIIYSANAFVGKWRHVPNDPNPNLENRNYFQWTIIGNIYPHALMM